MYTYYEEDFWEEIGYDEENFWDGVERASSVDEEAY
jgi:hypothetical protein